MQRSAGGGAGHLVPGQGLLDGRTGAVERAMRGAALCQLTALSHAIGAAARGESGPKPMSFRLPN